MIVRSSSFLGLSIGERTIACAEVPAAGPAEVAAVRKTAEFELPTEFSAATAESSGRALGSFLRSRGFSAGRAVVGVPARWLIAHERELPPADEQAASAILRLAAERLKSGDGREMVFDYAGRPDPAQPSRALILGMLQQRLTDVRKMVEAAGLTVVSLGASSLAVAAERGATLVLSRQGVELVCCDELTPRTLRHLSVGPLNGHGLASVAPLAAELRRSLVMMPAAEADGISLLDGVGMSVEQLGELSAKLGRPLTRPGTSSSADPFAIAIALARAGAQRQALPVDFIHSRLTERPKPRISRAAVLGGAAAVAVIVGVIALWYDVQKREARVADLNRQLKALDASVKAADENIGRVDFGRGYFDRRPPMMECLREITMAFRGDDSIWATSFFARDNRKATLIGKATNQRSPVALQDRLTNSSRLTDVKLSGMHEEGRAREITFSLSFDFARLDRSDAVKK